MEFYDKLAETYDLLISWRPRLRREKPFFTRIFREYAVRRVLDTACGTGMHAIAFHDWGYYVIGADISGKMVKKARENAGDREIEFVKAAFTDVEKIGGLFDAVTCLGNSLPHVLTDEGLRDSLRAMYDLLLPGGIIIIHGNNYDRVLSRKERFMPLAGGRREGREYLFIRFFDFLDDLLDFNIVSVVKDSEGRQMYRQATKHRALTRKLLTGMLKEVGFTDLRLYGGYPSEPYERLASDNLIVVAQKPHTKLTRPPKEPVVAIDRIPIRERGEPLVDVSTAVPEIATRVQPTCVRQSVAERLRMAQAALPAGYTLKALSSLRTLAHQKELYENYLAQLARRYPEWPTSRLRREANKFLAPPDSGHPPGHTTGGAVDVTILGPNGKDLDMTSSICPGAVGRMATLQTYSKEATPRAAKNRQLLIEVMSGAGFSNYPGEWWHWSYGDSAWALRTGHAYAIYGAAEPR